MTDYQLAQIAIMHYYNGLSQQEIAQHLEISKMTISRMLQKAKEQKIVKISVRLPFELDEALSNTLRQTYDLQRAIVVRQLPESQEALSDLLGQVWAFYMGTTRLDHTILGIGVGKTLAQVVHHVAPMKIKNLHVVQLMGGLSDVTSENPITLIQETCRKLHANGTYLTSMATVDDQTLRDTLLYHTAMGQRVIELWQQCQMALFGIGALERGTLLAADLVKATEIETLKQAGSVGDMLGHCFDGNGNFIKTSLEDRLISIPIELLRKIDERVAVAGGDYKAAAIRGALRSGIVTTLVTDDQTAQMLLQT